MPDDAGDHRKKRDSLPEPGDDRRGRRDPFAGPRRLLACPHENSVKREMGVLSWIWTRFGGWEFLIRKTPRTPLSVLSVSVWAYGAITSDYISLQSECLAIM